MNIDERSGRLVLEGIASGITDASTAAEAIAVIALQVQTLIPSLWRASVSQVMEGAAQLECVAVWCETETLVKPGVRVATLATAFPEVATRGRPVVSSQHQGQSSLLKHALKTQRTLSWVAIPLADGERITGLLGMSADEANAFNGADLNFYARVGRTVERRLFELI
jgi:hypothetical protein